MAVDAPLIARAMTCQIGILLPPLQPLSCTNSSWCYCRLILCGHVYRLQADVLAENMPRVYCYAEKKEQSIFDFNLDLNGRVSAPDPTSIFNGIHDVVHSFLEVHSKTQSNPVRVFIPHYHSILSNCDGAESRAGLLGAQLLLRLKHLMQHEHFPGVVENKVTGQDSSSKAHIRMTVLASILPSAIPATCGNSCLQTLNSLADTVLGVESFAGHADAVPIEFR